MKTEIILQRNAIERLIASYDELVTKCDHPPFREYLIGKRDAYRNVLILFSDDQSLSDLHSEAFTPSDES